MRSLNISLALIVIGSTIATANAADPVSATPTPPAPSAPTPSAPAPTDAPESIDAPAPAPTDAPAPAPTDAPAPVPSDDTPAATPALPVGVHGMLLDESTGVGLPAATITVLGTNKQTVIAELDGSFVISLPPGKYTLNFFTPLYDAKTTTVEVRKGVSTELAMSLEPSASSEEVIEVRGKIDTRTESASLAVRRAATVVSDGVSAQEISRTAASNASEAMKRVVSVSILDNKYVALRGLEGRYVTTLLNGIVLPSTEPDRNAVPLDLFPTSLLANLTVFKSYGAELPGQFGGGTLAIDTNSFPTKFESKVSLSTSANTVNIGQQGLFSTSRGTAGFFGFDGGNRQLPGAVPTNQALRGMTASEMTSIGQSFRNDWAPTEAQVAPNIGINATVGSTTTVAKRPLGYLVTGMMRHGFSGRSGESARTGFAGGQLQTTDSLAYDVGEREATVGALANVGYAIAEGHSINLFGLYSHVGSDSVATGLGYSEADGTNIDVSRLSFVERALGMAQLIGKHKIPRAHGLEIKWQVNGASTRRDELDTRDLVYTVDPTSAMESYKDQPGSGQRYWSFLSDKSFGGGADAMLPLGKVRLRAGTSLQSTDRGFRGRRFRYRYIGDDTSARTMPSDQIFSAENIGTDFEVQEDTLHEDSYQANISVAAGYLAADIEATSRLKLVAGARYERADQSLANGSRYAVAGVRANVSRTDNDVLPTANVVYALRDNTNLRAAYSYTLARPRFRELAPFLYIDYVRRRSLSGNPELQTTHIHNADVRWEYFPGQDEVVAASAFAKRFEQPIEQVLADSESNATFRNARSGNLVGVELEARVELSRLHRALAAFRLGGNLAVMRSRVQLPADNMILTNQSRPLYGQSPYVANASLEYRNPKVVDVGILYNVSGRRISDVGVEGLPDTYEEALHRIDLVASRKIGAQLRAKLSATNVANQAVRLTQGGINVDRFLPGSAIVVSLDWAPQ